MKNSVLRSSELSSEYGQVGWEKDPSSLFAYDREGRSPERDLWIEIVLQGLEDIGIEVREEQREVERYVWQEAVDWVMEENGTFHETDFEMVCHIARLDADSIKSKLRKYRCKCCKNLLIEVQCPRKTK